jgi:NAD(P)-dependent dehydrogenase (short-subunit alcohol dehydrogenase family)/acyl carrier protein
VYALQATNQDASPRDGFARLFHLAEALARSGKTTELSVITSDAYDVFGEGKCNPANRAVAWLGDVIGVEVNAIKRRVIDRDAKMAAPEEAHRLLSEITSNSSETLIALRGRKRWTPAWIPMPLESPATKPGPLRQRGAYILTGGIGGIGLVLAEYLAGRVAAHVVLVSRSAFPAEDAWQQLAQASNSDEALCQKAQALLRIQAAGGTVETKQADVQDYERMLEVVAQVRATRGGLQGIIHCAGVVDGSVIGATDPTAVQRIFAAKAEGSRWIADTLRQGDLDFVLLCSSLSAVIPSVGLAAYGGSNAYLDGFAAVHDDPSGTRVISVNWDNWSETGMAVDVNAVTKRRSAGAKTVDLGITNLEGGKVFELVLASQVSQVAVSTRDLPRLIEEVRSASEVQPGTDGAAVTGSDSVHPRPDLSHEYVAPQNEAERAVVEIWQELLGIDRIGVHDDFFELGGHSLLGAQFISRIRERFQVDIPLRIIFETPTPAACAQLVMAKSPVVHAASREAEREEIEI